MGTFKLGNRYLSEDVYKPFVDEKHFLVQLKRLFDWNALAFPLADLAKNTEGGRPRYSPVVMLKLVMLSFLFDLSDRDTEFFATGNLYAKYFLGLPIDEKAPDHSSISRFRDDVLTVKGVSYFTVLFRSFIGEAKEKGVVFGVVHALDATHTIANVDTYQDGNNVKNFEGKHRDKDASWGVKGHESKVTPKGEKIAVLKTFYGYKAHLLAETKNGIITGIHTSTGSMSDLDGGDILIHRILTKEERKNLWVLLADKGYGCPVWINLLEKYTGIMTAMSLPKTMLTKGEHQEKWKEYVNNDGRKAFRKDRYKIEQINGDLKQNHSMRRCRYLGNTKYLMQTTLSSIAHNLKIFVKTLSGVRLRPI